MHDGNVRKNLKNIYCEEFGASVYRLRGGTEKFGL